MDGALLASYGTFYNDDYNVYFAGRKVWAESVDRALQRSPDWLGSMVKNFPYGDEPTGTTPNREKFATYYRDVT